MLYSEVKIGTLRWLSENLHEVNFRNGDPIKQVFNEDELKLHCENEIPVWHYPDFDNSLEHLGLYYNTAALIDKRGIGPNDWIIPGQSDWLNLIHFTGYLFSHENSFLWDSNSNFRQERAKSNISALSSLKAKNGWASGNHKGNNLSRFNAIPEKNGTYTNWCYLKDGKIGWFHIGSVPKESIGVEFDSYTGSHSFGKNFMLSHQVRLIHKDKIDLLEGEAKDVIIGEQAWMNRNLDVTHFINGDEIQYADSSNEWEDALRNEEPAWCWYDVVVESIFGKLYNFFSRALIHAILSLLVTAFQI